MSEGFTPSAVFFDLDGTTYQHSIHEVPASTYVALEQLHDRGVRLAGCTSRVPNELVHLPKHFTDLLDGLICCAGDLIEVHGTLIAKHVVDPLDACRIRDYCRMNHVVMRWSDAGQQGCVDYWHDEPVMGIFEYLYQMRPAIQPYTHQELVHIVLFPPMNATVEQQLRHCLTRSNLIVLNRTYEVTSQGISKASGLQELAAYWGISLDHSVSVGDGKNDMAMFAVTGLSIAMGQAIAEVKAAADYATAPIDQDGFYRAFVHYGMIEDVCHLVEN